jgi:imidazolonepropionase-like amidohydrolase
VVLNKNDDTLRNLRMNNTQNRLALRVRALIDGTGRGPLYNATVLIQRGRIVAVGPHIFVPDEYEVIDLPDSTIIPGLIDGHTHTEVILSGKEFGNDGASEEIWQWHVDEFLTHGVTAVRDTGGTGIGEAYQLLTAENNPNWPRFVGSGPNLDGPPGAPYPGLRVVRGPEDAAQNAAELIAAGVPFLKTYVWLPFVDLQAVVDEAHSHGISVATHVGTTLTVEQAVSLGVDALEHICSGHELLDDASRELEAALPTRPHDWCLSLRPWRFINLASDRVRRHIDLLAESAVTITPTLAILDVISRSQEASQNLRSRSNIPESLITAWQSSWPAESYSDDDLAGGNKEWETLLEFVSMLHAADIPIVAGTDIPNPATLPGSSLHQEIQLLSNCGLGIVGAIHSATGQAAKLMGRNDIGTVRSGKKADLLVVSGDLTTSLRPLSNIQAVLRDGKVVKGKLPERCLV